MGIFKEHGTHSTHLTDGFGQQGPPGVAFKVDKDGNYSLTRGSRGRYRKSRCYEQTPT